MNLGEALLELKSQRSELSRLLELRENLFRHDESTTIPADENVFDLTKQIQHLAVEIRKLKIRIEETNHSRSIDTPDGKMTLAEAIHLVGDMRSELAALEKLRSKYSEERFGWREETRKYRFAMPQKELLSQISSLEKRKVRLDSFLSSWNWKVELHE